MRTEALNCLVAELTHEKTSKRHRTTPQRVLPLLLVSLLALGCGDGSSGGAAGTGGGGETGGTGGVGPGPTGPRYVIASLLFSDVGSTSFVKVLDDLEPQEVNFDDAREIPGQGDVWVYGSNVYIAVDETRRIQRFTIADDGSWQEGETIGFANFGVPGVAFWNNTFINSNKAYLANGDAEYIVWDPQEMLIGETIDIPQLPGPAGTRMEVSFADRAVVIRDGLLYQTVYWADEDLADFAPNSAILVFDTETDTHINTIEAPCPGLDTATRDDEGNLYFSNWVFSVGAHIVYDEPENCIVRIPAGSEEIDESWTASFSALLEGREGAAARYLSDDTAIISVFHDEDVVIGNATHTEVIAGADWSAQYLDLTSQTATPINGIERNSGAFYSTQVAGRSFVLVPGLTYGSTIVYEVQPGEDAVELFEVDGWSLRLFELP